MDGVRGRAAEHARMQVAVGAPDHDLLADQPAQHGGDGGRVGVPHAGVADEREVGLELVRVGVDEGGKRRRTGLLLALEQNRHVAGQAARLAEGANGLDERHELALVVAGPARHDPLAVADLRLERIARPERQRVDRLHVVMAVEQDVRGIAMRSLSVTDDDRPARGRPDGGVEAELGQLRREPVGGAPALLRIGGVGRDRRDREEFEQAVERTLSVAVNLAENGVDRCHDGASRYGSGTLALSGTHSSRMRGGTGGG